MDQKMNSIATIVSVVGLVLAVFLLATANKPEINFTPEGVEHMDTLSVTGLAEMTVSPDKATAEVEILTSGETAQEAQQKNTETSDKVITALKNAGVDAEDIETVSYYLYKRTEWDPEQQKSVETGYELRHSIKVTTNDIDSVAGLVDTAISNGANGVNRVSFGLQKETEKRIRDEALKKAAEVAKAKAQSIASTLGVKLGKITSISESNFYYTPFEYAPNYARDEAFDTAAGSSITPQKVEVNSNIGLVFEIN